MTTPPRPAAAPASPRTAPPSSGPSGGGSFWTRKLGPLPGWVWVSLIGATGAVGWYLWKQHQNATDAAAAAAQTTAPSPDQATTDQTDFAGQIAALQAEIQDLEGQTTPTGGGPPPPGQTTVQVPDVVGLDLDHAAEILKSTGLVPPPSASQPGRAGEFRMVSAQDPKAGATVAKGSRVMLTWGYRKEVTGFPIPKKT